MKRSTRKFVFITAMLATVISLGALTGRHHAWMRHHHCLMQQDMCERHHCDEQTPMETHERTWDHQQHKIPQH